MMHIFIVLTMAVGSSIVPICRLPVQLRVVCKERSCFTLGFCSENDTFEDTG